MKKNSIRLTDTDRAILDSYCRMLEGLSAYLGGGYEIVLHSLENYDHSAIKVINGFYTGRKEGASITDLALNLLEQIQHKDQNASGITYFATNAKGEPLKSSTIPIRGEKGRIIGLLCINFYLNTPVADFLNNFCGGASSSPELQTSFRQEHFSSDSSALIRDAVRQTKNEVFMDQAISSSNRNKEIIRRLHQKGIFHLKDAVLLTAQELEISKNTVYLHLRHIDH